MIPDENASGAEQEIPNAIFPGRVREPMMEGPTSNRHPVDPFSDYFGSALSIITAGPNGLQMENDFAGHKGIDAPSAGQK